MAVGTCLGMDGFDGYALSDWAKHWTTVPAGANDIRATYSLNGRGQGALLTNGTLTMNLGSNYAQGMICGRFQINAGTIPSRTLLAVLDGATEQCSLRTDGSSRLIVTQGGTQKGSTGPVLSNAVTYFFEFQFIIHNSTGTFDLHINGASVATSGGNVDLTGTANNYWNGLSFPIPNGINVWIDDIIWFDTSTGTDFIGPGTIYTSLPSAAGNHTDWTPSGGTNFGNVQEPYEDGDLSFNMSATANQIDSFVMQSLPIAAGTIVAIQQKIVVRQDAGAQRTVRQLCREGGTDDLGATLNPSSTYTVLRDIRQTKVGGGAYAVADANGREDGYKITI